MYRIILDFVPIEFEADNLAYLEQIEERNGLDLGTIVKAHWIKPKHRRSSTQQVALLQLDVTSPQVANFIIGQGLIINGKPVYGRKSIPEPKRCMKCQQFSPPHFAAACKSIHDTCATCGSLSHVSTACNVTERAQFGCSNCKQAGHAAWDRACPAFLQAMQKLGSRQPDMNYKVFPIIDEPNTWELLDRPAHAPFRPQEMRQPLISRPQPEYQRDSNLDWSREVEREFPLDDAHREGPNQGKGYDRDQQPHLRNPPSSSQDHHGPGPRTVNPRTNSLVQEVTNRNSRLGLDKEQALLRPLRAPFVSGANITVIRANAGLR